MSSGHAPRSISSAGRRRPIHHCRGCAARDFAWASDGLECPPALAYSNRAWASERRPGPASRCAPASRWRATVRLDGEQTYGMRCNWRRWLWGLIPLVMVSCVAILVERGRIEHDLAERTSRALGASESSWAKIAFEGRDANLSGRALQDEQPANAERIIRGVWGVREVNNNAALPPKVEPFLWSARLRGNRLRLFGYVPNRLTRRTIIGMANAVLPGVDVSDRMSTARGVPHVDTWLAGLSFAMKQLALLKRGDVRLEDLALTISGEAENAEAYRALTASLKAERMPKGITLASAQITAPVASPFVWSVQYAGAQVILSGHVAGESARAELLAAANAGASRITVVDRMEFAEGAPQGWPAAAVGVLKDLMRLQSGEAEIKDSAVSASGIAVDEATAQSVRTGLRSSLPPSFKLTHQITVREPPPPPAPKAEIPAPKQNADAPKEERKERPTAKSEPTPLTASNFPPLELEPPPPIPPAKDLEPATPPAPSAKQSGSTAPEPAPSTKMAATPALPAEPQPAIRKEPAPVVVPPPAAPAPPAEAAPKAAVAPLAKAREPEDACGGALSKVDISGHILFDTNSSKLDTGSLSLLDRLAAAAQSCNGLRIAIEGHTDTDGSARYNKSLSVRRARAVQDYLLKTGMRSQQLEAIGYGYARPAAPNDTPENMAKNRRIEFVIRR